MKLHVVASEPLLALVFANIGNLCDTTMFTVMFSAFKRNWFIYSHAFIAQTSFSYFKILQRFRMFILCLNTAKRLRFSNGASLRVLLEENALAL